MQLFETAGNPMPPRSTVSGITTSDGVRLRTARWSSEAPRGSVALAIGRSEFIEQYSEIVRGFLARQFDVVAFDWRGQGQSDREIAHGRRGYVSSFAGYRRDLEALEAYVLRPFAPKPWFALGHSMGASILIDQAHDGASPFERLVLSAPMIDIPLRYARTIRRCVRAADALGLGTRLIPGGREESLFIKAFEGNVLTSDLRQYQRIATAIRVLPALAVGAPTIRWLRCAFELMDRFKEPGYAPSTLVPTLIIAAGVDRIVDTAATERFAIRLKAGSCITIPEARHQIIMEGEAITDQVWAAIDAFIPPYEAKRPDHQRRLPRPAKVGLF